MKKTESIKIKHSIIKRELDRYKELLGKAENEKSNIPFYKSMIKEMEEWLSEFEICETCGGNGRYRFIGNNYDCEDCNGTEVSS